MRTRVVRSARSGGGGRPAPRIVIHHGGHTQKKTVVIDFILEDREDKDCSEQGQDGRCCTPEQRALVMDYLLATDRLPEDKSLLNRRRIIEALRDGQGVEVRVNGRTVPPLLA